MAGKLARTFLSPLSRLLPGKAGFSLTALFSRDLQKELDGAATDKFLELLLAGMDLAFILSRDFRENIRGFAGRYLFRTADGLVAVAALFTESRMRVSPRAITGWDVRVTFKDAGALRAFLFSREQDILDSLLKNEVEVDGNLNYIYKFGFMARELRRRLCVP